MSFLIFLSKRFFGLLILLLILSILVFTFSRSIPGDVAAMYVGDRAGETAIEKARIELGLDKPLHIQYLVYIQKLVKGDMGISLRTHRPVFQDLLEKTPMSLEVVFMALLVALATGIPLGVLATLKQGTFFDEAVKWISSAMVSLPIFFLALLLQILFFNKLGWFPLQGRIDSFLEFESPIELVTGFSLIDTLITGNYAAFWNLLWHMVLPVMALAIYPFGLVTRLTRSSLIDVMGENYILSARASGISERVLFFRYGLRNAISPVLTVLGLSLALTLLNTFYVEQIFNWPGIGYYSLTAILSLDYPVLMGVTMVIGTIYVVANTLTDILRKLIDPRIK